jgi:hypothetical protein
MMVRLLGSNAPYKIGDLAKMKRKPFIILILIAGLVAWRFHSAFRAYGLLLFVSLGDSYLPEPTKRKYLSQVIDSGFHMQWNNVDNSIIEKFKPKGKHIVRTRFIRGTSLPTGQVILEFFIGEIESGKNGDYTAGYLVVIYLQRDVSGEYQQVSMFKRFNP